ncbi:prenyltransferase [bacterium]|nr:prenyltransferase [bacterium]
MLHARRFRRASTALIVVAVSLVATTPALQAQSKLPRQAETSGVRFMNPQTLERIEKGLKWLAARQNADGAFGVGRGYGRNVGVVSLAGMAWLSSGSTPGRGPYGERIQQATDFVLTASRSSGFITVPEGQSHGPMYGHGFATLFLAEVYGMSPRPEIRERLEKAVHLIVASQNREGGWRYDPLPKEADISVTVCQIMALRAARNCGLFVPRDTVDLCIEYVRECQNDDGGFKYQLVRRSPSQFARSAAGLVALYSAGVYEGAEITRGLNYLTTHRPTGFIDPHYYYGHYYAVQAMYQAGGDHWENWYPRVRDQLLGDQLRDGSWSDTTFSGEYATAMALIVLQLPNNYLPIFQR